MTTIVGLETTIGEPAIIIASDRQSTNGDGHGNDSKSDVDKLYVSRDGTFVIGIAGIADDKLWDFVLSTMTGKYDVAKALETGYFHEFNALNQSRWDRRAPTQHANQILIASRINGNVGLYHCFPLGLVEKASKLVIGSGTPYAEQAYRSYSPLQVRQLTVGNAFTLAYSMVTHANQDLYSVGFDACMINKDEIRPVGNTLAIKQHKHRDQILEEMARSLEPTHQIPLDFNTRP